MSKPSNLSTFVKLVAKASDELVRHFVGRVPDSMELDVDTAQIDALLSASFGDGMKDVLILAACQCGVTASGDCAVADVVFIALVENIKDRLDSIIATRGRA